MMKALLPVASRMVMTQPATARAYTAEELETIGHRQSAAAKIDLEPDPVRAIEHAWSYCPVVCAAGSIFLVGNLLEAFGPQGRDL